jgi:hypothetical protein
MVEVVIGEMFGSDRSGPIDYGDPRLSSRGVRGRAGTAKGSMGNCGTNV